jgi:hypothetical protein
MNGVKRIPGVSLPVIRASRDADPDLAEERERRRAAMPAAWNRLVGEQVVVLLQDRRDQFRARERPAADRDIFRHVFRPGKRAAIGRAVVGRHHIPRIGDSLVRIGASPSVGRQPRKELVVIIQALRVVLRSVEEERIPGERLRRVLDLPHLAVEGGRPFLPAAYAEPNCFSVGIGPGAVDQLEHVLLLRTRVADRILGLRNRGRGASRDQQAERDKWKSDVCEH